MVLLDPGEHVLLEIRKHWFVFVSQALIHLFVAVVPYIGYKVLVKLVPLNIPLDINPTGLLLFLYSLWLLTVWIIFFTQWTKYYLDVWYVTEKRIIDIEQIGLFHRSVSSLRFEKIQDISINTKGFIATFLNMGDIRVQTAAEDSGDFFMKQASSPDSLRNTIFSQHNEASEKFMPKNQNDNSTSSTENYL